jgi:hypothetical protein
MRLDLLSPLVRSCLRSSLALPIWAAIVLFAGVALGPCGGGDTPSKGQTGSTDGTATPDNRVIAPPPEDYVEIILDLSGSMLETAEGETKLSIAKRVLNEFLIETPINARVGFRTYSGHRLSNAEGCRDTSLLVPIGPDSKAIIRASLEPLQAAGTTPIGYSLEEAAKDFKVEPGRINTILLISDGEETCGGDAVALIKKLDAQGFRLRVDVIGFFVDAQTEAFLRTISSSAKGKYHSVDSANAFKAAICEELCPANVTPVPVIPASQPVEINDLSWWRVTSPTDCTAGRVPLADVVLGANEYICVSFTYAKALPDAKNWRFFATVNPTLADISRAFRRDANSEQIIFGTGGAPWPAGTYKMEISLDGVVVSGGSAGNSIVPRVAPPAATATALPGVTPPTATPVPPTATPAPGVTPPTATPTPTPTRTPAPTSTNTPSPTSTPTPTAYQFTARLGDGKTAYAPGDPITFCYDVMPSGKPYRVNISRRLPGENAFTPLAPWDDDGQGGCHSPGVLSPETGLRQYRLQATIGGVAAVPVITLNVTVVDESPVVYQRTVSGTSPLTDMDIVVPPGASVMVTATGTVYFVNGDNGAGPGGGDCEPGVYPALTCHALVGRIGFNGPVFFVGSFVSFTHQTGGRLFLGVNDTTLSDNSGSWAVTITVTP